MDRKPALTKKVIRGFSWITMTAKADLDTTMSDMYPSLSKEEADEVETALNWMDRTWARDQRKGKEAAKSNGS